MIVAMSICLPAGLRIQDLRRTADALGAWRCSLDIRVGSTTNVGKKDDARVGRTAGVEARVLAVRRPRRQSVGRPGPGPERRETDEQSDPLTGRVLVLMIPDGSRLPEGIEAGQYRVFLRFARR